MLNYTPQDTGQIRDRARTGLAREQANQATKHRTAALGRLQQIEGDYSKYPGRAAGGTGLTGLTSGDSHGYSDLLNEQIEHQNLSRELQGKGPVDILGGLYDEQHVGGVEPVSMSPALHTGGGINPRLNAILQALRSARY